MDEVIEQFGIAIGWKFVGVERCFAIKKTIRIGPGVFGMLLPQQLDNFHRKRSGAARPAAVGAAPVKDGLLFFLACPFEVLTQMGVERVDNALALSFFRHTDHLKHGVIQSPAIGRVQFRLIGELVEFGFPDLFLVSHP